MGIEKTRIVPLGNLIRSFASMFLQDPHRATRYYKTLLEQVGRNIFAPNHKLDPYYTSAYALYRLEYIFRNQTLDPKYKIARYHLLLVYRFIVNKTKLPPMNSNEMERRCDEILQTLWDSTKSEEIFMKAAEIIESVAQKQGGLEKDNIRTQSFTDLVLEASNPR